MVEPNRSGLIHIPHGGAHDFLGRGQARHHFARAEVLNGAARVDTSVLAALKLDAGAQALVWIDDAN